MKKWNWKHKVVLVFLGLISATSIQLLFDWVLGVDEPWGSLVGSMAAGSAAVAFWRTWRTREVWGSFWLMTGIQYELMDRRTAGTLTYHALLIIVGAYLLFGNELRQAMAEYRSKRSERARRQHLRNVLKNIDAEAAKLRDSRNHVSQELERLEPKPTYRVADSPDERVEFPLANTADKRRA
ncbi:MAG TPA: hypothetical protein VMU11_02255 [Verrucomicrobiae bacterium]|nr:hypothetical protein [Verrucomicrobiae bacterium]